MKQIYFKSFQKELPRLQKMEIDILWLMRMYFTTNHDEDGSETSFERLKEATKAFAVLSFAVPGMPVIQSGQETANTYKAGFIKKEYLDFQNHEMTDSYTQLISIKDKNPALWNGSYGGDYKRLINGSDSSVTSFICLKDKNKVLSLINLSLRVQ